jgi:ABC-type multidrug transport system fused ATPase/permease subunit
VLNKGQVVASGTHKKLLTTNEDYKNGSKFKEWIKRFTLTVV